MKVKAKILVSIVCLIGLSLLVSGSADDEPEKRVMDYLAVMNLKCDKSITRDQCSTLTDIVLDEIVRLGKYTVIDRANRDKILSEIGFQQTGCVEGSCVVEAGRLLGVGKIVVGKASKLGNTYVVSLQLINVETATVETSARERCDKCEISNLIDTVANAARKLMGQSPLPTPSVEEQPQPKPTPSAGQAPGPDEIKFIAATPEQRAKCGPDMVYVPAGWFMMGCNSSKDSACGDDEAPYHAVYLDAYCIDKYEYPNQAGATPKANINWNDAQGICSSQGKKLPTEAQWEKAARGTDGRVYPWGDYMDADKRKALSEKYNSGRYSWNVSPYGAYDMSGNLWEWVADWYDENYYNGSPNRNPTGPTSGKYRVLRGGSWGDDPDFWRSSFRSWNDPDFRLNSIGFRCARTL